MNAWHGFNTLFYATLFFWSVPAMAWWVWFVRAVIQKVRGE